MPRRTTVVTQPAVKQDNLAFIMTDPALCLCPGLFRQVTPAEQELPIYLRLDYQHGETILKVHGPLLSGFDLAVLQAISLLAKEALDFITGEPGTHATLRDAIAADEQLEAEHHPEEADRVEVLRTVDQDLCYARFSMGRLLATVGLPNNAHYVNQAMDSLMRLASVTLFVAAADRPKHFSSYRLLSKVQTGESRRTQQVHVALNPRLTEAVAGRVPQDVRLNAQELREISTHSATRVLHQRLCAIINDGVSRRFKLSTLTEYLFPSDATAQALTLVQGKSAKRQYDVRQRRAEVVQQAIEGLSELHWQVSRTHGEDEPLFEITRPTENWTYRQLRQAKQAVLEI